MSEPEAEAVENPTAGSTTGAAAPSIAFSPGRMKRELWSDGTVRGAALLVILTLFLGVIMPGFGPATLVWGAASVRGGAAWLGPLDTLLSFALMAGLWVWLALANAKVAGAMPELTAAIEHSGEAGEAMLARLLSRRGLTRWVRLMLYQRLATLRHRQERFAEAAAVAQSVLETPRAGPVDRGRGALLLLLIEARLELRDVAGAYYALLEATFTPMSLAEALQRMALRTRYELMIGLDTAVLDVADLRLRLSELMPGAQCGALHAMFALAAKREGDADRHDRWWQRATLLCTPEQVQQIERM